MIEVEIKFPLIKNNEQLITADAKFMGEKQVTDVYYDNPAKKLTLADQWLRCRNGQFELKIPVDKFTKNSAFVARRYSELTTDREIMVALYLSGENLASALEHQDYAPFATVNTTRRSYQHDPYHIDIDRTDFGYALGEVERLITDPAQAQKTEREIQQFLADRHIAYSQGHIGKVAHYLQKHDPEHFHLLIEAGVISPNNPVS